MKALSLIQPWANLIALGEKRIETRSWSTPYRGPLAIHASKSIPREVREMASEEPQFLDAFERHNVTLGDLPCGVVVATAVLTHCVHVDRDTRNRIGQSGKYPEDEVLFGDYTPGRFAWVLSDIRPLAEPVPARGSLGLWEWECPFEQVSLMPFGQVAEERKDRSDA